jgi:MFS family permease
MRAARPWPITLCFLAAALLVAVPVLCVRMPPLVDYPAHLAGVHVLQDLLTTRRFASIYQLQVAVIPNLAMVASVLPLALAGLDIEVAGRVFLLAACLGVAFGVCAVHRALFDRASFVPLIAFAYAYNEMVTFGFLNWLAGVALALFGFAWWVRARRVGPPRPGAYRRLASGMVVWSVAIFFAHLMALLLLLGLVLAYEVAASSGWRDRLWRLRALLPAGLATAALIAMAPVTRHQEGPGLLGPFFATLHDPGLLRERLWLFKHALVGSSLPVDIASAALLGVLAVVSLARGRVRVAWPMTVPIAGLAIAGLVGPSTWHGTAFIADRWPGVVLLLLVASVDVRPVARHDAVLLGAALMLLAVGRTGVVTWHWLADERAYDQMRLALAAVAPGATIYSVVNARGGSYGELAQPWSHFSAYAALDQTVYVADMWAEPDQSLIVRTPVYQALQSVRPWAINHVARSATPEAGADMLEPAALRQFDFLLAVRPELYQRPLPLLLTPVKRAGDAILFHIRHDMADTGVP